MADPRQEECARQRRPSRVQIVRMGSARFIVYEVETGRAILEQSLAQARDGVDAEFPHRLGIVGEALDPLAQPPGNLHPRGLREANETLEVCDGHDARDDRQRHAEAGA